MSKEQESDRPVRDSNVSAGGINMELGMLENELRSSSNEDNEGQSLMACGSWWRRLDLRSIKKRRGNLEMEDDTWTMLLLAQLSRSKFLMLSISYGISVRSLLDMSTDVSDSISKQAFGNSESRKPAIMSSFVCVAASRARRYCMMTGVPWASTGPGGSSNWF